LVWAYKEFQKGKEGSKGWNDGLRVEAKTKKFVFLPINNFISLQPYVYLLTLMMRLLI
jgi:hypothetical protein